MEKVLKINEVLKKLMKAEGLTLVALSSRTGVPKSTLSEWLSNRTPNPIQAAKVARIFNVSLHFLLFGTEDPQELFQKIMKEDLFSGTFEISIKKVKIN